MPVPLVRLNLHALTCFPPRHDELLKWRVLIIDIRFTKPIKMAIML